ncbi:deleted in malignant brain tumors 1 protein-like isoform X2 [Plectropomus leopardus]|uniref:deleted in malignant brain tumors 1 protein-like isoform X2 n=1 Tax=Plectropomus leopardus TaxID=160734 RepID=UPI001C4BD311|nr:deleted in malignant brain tumors 1 protein-like isoform X2 [Plectropomus leopardus]
MQLLKYILIVQLGCFCQALQNSSTQTDPPGVQVTEERNNSAGRIPEEFSSDPYVHRLSGKCSFALRIPGNRSSDVVALPADSIDVLVEQICQDLGCGSTYHVNKTSSPPNTTCFHRCVHGDGRLQNCSQTVEGNCSVITEAVCGHQALRLAGGLDRCAGRVELWRHGRWGTVCDDQWDLRDANVVCAQLGCGYALSVTGQGGSYPPGRGPVYRDELNCTGREENLWACPAAQDETDCGHKEDAGVICSEMRAVRLTGGLDRCAGVVEVHRNGSWGTVCDNCWNEKMASMVCSMLQCGGKPQQFTQFNPPLAHNNGSLWFYMCDRHTQNLWQCDEYVNRTHLCATSKASGVICNGSLGFPAPTTAPTANTAVMTTRTTGATSVSRAKGLFLSPAALLITSAVTLLLLVVLITNSVLCCHYRRRHAFLIQQTRSSTRPPSENHQNSYQETVDLIKVTPNPLQTEDSQRYRADVNSLMRPSGLDSLFEEVPEPTNEVMGAFTCHNGGPAEAPYARVSKISVDSFDTSSTSSGEFYENTNDYSAVTPDSAPGQLPVVNGDQLYPGQTTSLQSSGDEDDGPHLLACEPRSGPHLRG